MNFLPQSRNVRSTNAFGFLRVALAGMVVYSHSHLLGGFPEEWLIVFSRKTLFFGFWAVQAFFILSGYLIAQSWIQMPNLQSFLKKRILRLVPALWVCLLFTAFVLTPLLHVTTPASSRMQEGLAMESVSYVGSNLIMPRTKVAVGPYPGNIPWPGDWNGSLWTLFYEGSAYLIVAAVGFSTLLTRFPRVAASVIFSLLVMGTVGNMQPGLLGWPLSRLFDTVGKQLILYFAAGMCWALVPSLRVRNRNFFWGLLVGAALVLTVKLGLHPVTGLWLMPPFLFWLSDFLPFKNFEQAVGGDFSYGLYIYNYPVLQTLAHFGLNRYGYWPYFLLSFAITLALAMLSWHLIEARALSWSHRKKSNKEAGPDRIQAGANP